MLASLRWLSRRSLRLLHALGAALGWLVYAAVADATGGACARNAGAGRHRAAQRARARSAEAGRHGGRAALRSGCARRDAPIADPVRWDGASAIEAALGAGPRPRASDAAPGLLRGHRAGLCRALRRAPADDRAVPAGAPGLAARAGRRPRARRPALATAPATLAGVRQMIARAARAARRSACCPTRCRREGMGVWAPFFGRPAYTMTLAGAAGAADRRAACCWCCGERLPRGAAYVVRVSSRCRAAADRGRRRARRRPRAPRSTARWRS